MQAYSLPLPIHPPPNACAHCDRHSTKGRVRFTMFLKQKTVHSWTTQCAISQDNSRRWWCTLKVSTSRDSRQTIAYTITFCSRTWPCSCHSLEIALKTSRLAAIKDGMGAKLATNGDTCDVLKSSPKVLFFVKTLLQEYTLGMFANLVAS